MPYGAPHAAGDPSANPIINGDARVNQVSAGNAVSAVTINGNGTVYNNVDNWPLTFANGPNTFSVNESQSRAHPILGALGFSRLYNCTATPAIGAGLFVAQGLKLETFNVADFLDQPLTLSFWVMSPFTGRHYVTFMAGTTGVPGSASTYAAPYTINVASAWEFKTITIDFPSTIFTGAPSGVTALTIQFPMILGSNYRFAANFISTWNVGVSNVVAGTDFQQMITMGGAGIFRVTDVLLGIRGQTTFTRSNFSDELARCLRYYWQTFPYGIVPAQQAGANGRINSITYPVAVAGIIASGVRVPHPVEMRQLPAVTYYNPEALNALWRNFTNGSDSGAAATNASFSDAKATFVDITQAAAEAAGDIMTVAAAFNARL